MIENLIANSKITNEVKESMGVKYVREVWVGTRGKTKVEITTI